MNWTQLSAFYEYTEEIKKVMYTTNVIENVHRQFRKVTKSKGVFPTDMSLLKQLYLVVIDLDKKWDRILKEVGIRFLDNWQLNMKTDSQNIYFREPVGLFSN